MMLGMDTPRARHKLDEAGFFLQHLGKEREGDPAAFGYFLSAFLNAAYSLVKLLEVEVKRELKKDAENKKKAKAAFGPWYESWVKNLSREEHELWVLMEAQRRDEVHLLGAETVKETKAIPLEPPRDNPALFTASWATRPRFSPPTMPGERNYDGSGYRPGRECGAKPRSTTSRSQASGGTLWRRVGDTSHFLIAS